jgi:hypothetical protein
MVLLRKLSELTGTPLSRMVYVGDSEIDYKACEHLRLSFIESREGASKLGYTSLITLPGGVHLGAADRHFCTYRDESLPALLKQIDDAKSEEKYGV